MAKIAENCDYNIDPRGSMLLIKKYNCSPKGWTEQMAILTQISAIYEEKLTISSEKTDFDIGNPFHEKSLLCMVGW
jgi:hypothetical protein